MIYIFLIIIFFIIFITFSFLILIEFFKKNKKFSIKKNIKIGDRIKLINSISINMMIIRKDTLGTIENISDKYIVVSFDAFPFDIKIPKYIQFENIK